MAFSITNRGSDGNTYSQSPSAVGDTFTPTEGNIIIVGVRQSSNYFTSMAGWGITFVQINNTNVGGGILRTGIWAGIVGSSPGSDSLDITSSAANQWEVAIIELSGADTTGTAAGVFVQNQTEGQISYGSTTDFSCVTGGFTLAFDNANNGTLLWLLNAGVSDNTGTSTGGFTVYQTTTTPAQEHGEFQFATSEVADPQFNPAIAYTDYAATIMEIKLASAGGTPTGNPFNTPFNRPFGGPV